MAARKVTPKEIAAELGIHESNLRKVQENPDFQLIRERMLKAFADQHGRRIANP